MSSIPVDVPASAQSGGGKQLSRTATADGEARGLARAFLQQAGFEGMVDVIATNVRGTIVANLVRQGRAKEDAVVIVNRVLIPEIRTRTPYLASRFEDVLATDLTSSELQAIVSNKTGPARRSAQSKLPDVQAHLSAVGRVWATKLTTDLLGRNGDAFSPKAGSGDPGEDATDPGEPDKGASKHLN